MHHLKATPSVPRVRGCSNRWSQGLGCLKNRRCQGGQSRGARGDRGGEVSQAAPGASTMLGVFSVREAGGMGCVSLESDYELNTS